MGQKIIIYFFSMLTIIACSETETPLLMDPPKEVKVVETKALPPIQKMKTKVDIIFMLDNSNSMKNEIEKIKENAHKFTDNLKKFPQVDPHIGVIYTFDSSRYTNDPNNSRSVLKFHPLNGRLQFFDKGELVFLNQNKSKRFLTKKDLNILPEYFNIEVPFIAVKNDKKQEFPIGPEIEEMFSPLVAATQNNTENNGFFREDALLVIVFVTDAETGDIPLNKQKSQPDLINTVENISPMDLYNQLFTFKSGKAANLLAYGVLCNIGDSECQNKGIEHDAEKIRSFINIVHDKRRASLQARVKDATQADKMLESLRILNLHSDDWGEKLASIGEAISKETIMRPIYLNFIPETKEVTDKDSNKYIFVPQIKVKLGEQILEYGKDWYYDAAENSVTLLPPVLEIKNKNNLDFSVTGIAVETGPNTKAIKL